MPSVLNSRRRGECFSPVTCQICYKAVGNAQALACHHYTHMIDRRTNPKATTFVSSMGMSDFSPSSSYLNTNIHQSLLSPSSFSIFNNRNGLVTNPSSNSKHHHGALFNGPMNNMFRIMETPSTLYNVILSDDGITTRPLICQLDRPLPEIIELDTDDEENEVHDDEMLDLNLKL